MIKPKDILKRPIITEKGTQASGMGCYVFEVEKKATKLAIAQAVEKAFGTKVERVKTITVRGKIKRSGRQRRQIKQADRKKAIVKLAEGEKIDFLESGE